MRCSKPWWRLSEALDGQGAHRWSASDDPALETSRCAWRMNPVEGVGREGRGTPDGAVPHRGDAHPDGALLCVLHHVRAQVGDRRSPGLDLRRGGTSDRHRRPVPGLLVLATLGISVRTVIYLLSGNDFVYFFQPIMRTVATAAVVRPLRAHRPAARRPVRGRLLPAQPGRPERPAVVQLFRRLTYLWAAVNAVAAAATLTLLLTVPVAVFVGTAAASTWVLTCSGVVLTVSESVRTARREGLHTAVSPNGRLHAYVTPIVSS